MEDEQATEQTATDTASTDDATGTNGGNDAASEPRYTKAQLDQIVKERLDRAAESEKRKRDAAEQKARDDAAAEQGKFAELAETRGKRVAELEPQVETLTTERDRALAVIKTQVEARTKDLPDAAKKLLAGRDMVDQFELLPEIEALTGTTTKNGGPPPTVRGVGNLTDAEQLAALAKQQDRTRAAF